MSGLLSCKSQKIVPPRNERNDWIRRRLRRRVSKCTMKNLRHDLQEYCESTTLHGFRYLTSDEVTSAGKLTWLTICLLSLSLSIYLMLSVWDKYRMIPADIRVESTAYPIWGLPFPGVSICNINKVYRPQADKMAVQMKLYGMNESEIRCFFDAMPSMIHERFSNVDNKRGMATLARIGFGPESLMHHLMQPCDKLLVDCRWRGIKYNCSKIFKTVKTFQGLCCGFNYHARHAVLPHANSEDQRVGNKTAPLDISEEPGIHEPLKVPGSGQDAGLSLVINVESEMYRAPIRPCFGASIVLHDPLVFPEINVQTITVQPGQEMTIHADGSIIESEESLRKLSLKQRKCWFHDEIKLNSTLEYRYEACITECRMEHIYAGCDCVPFYYPKTIEGARTCGLLDLRCLEIHRRSLAQLEAPYNDANTITSVPTLMNRRCRNKCLPRCTETGCTLITARTHFMPKEKAQATFSNETFYFDTSNESVVSIFFPDITCLKYRRESVMTWENVFAAFGGIFGLCIGGSFVSMVEILYFLIIRIYRPRRSAWSKSTLPVDRSVGSLTARIQNQRIKLTNDHLQHVFHCNKSTRIMPSNNSSNCPKEELKKMAFTIDICH